MHLMPSGMGQFANWSQLENGEKFLLKNVYHKDESHDSSLRVLSLQLQLISIEKIH